MLLNIEFKVNLNELKEQIEEIAKEAYKVLVYIAIPVIDIAYIISVYATGGSSAILSSEVCGIILAILYISDDDK